MVHTQRRFLLVRFLSTSFLSSDGVCDWGGLTGQALTTAGDTPVENIFIFSTLGFELICRACVFGVADDSVITSHL